MLEELLHIFTSWMDPLQARPEVVAPLLSLLKMLVTGVREPHSTGAGRARQTRRPDELASKFDLAHLHAFSSFLCMGLGEGYGRNRGRQRQQHLRRAGQKRNSNSRSVK